MANRIIIGLLSLTLLVQGAIFYNQYSRSSEVKQRQGQRREFVVDAPPDKTIDIHSFPSQGSKEAKVALIEFSDYQCPFCQKHAAGVGKQLDQEFVATGKVKHVFVNHPLPIHQNAALLATAALCAGEQNRYWEMHDALFSAKPDTREAIVAASSGLGVDKNSFDACLSRDIAAELALESKIAEGLRLSGTPGFAVGYIDDQGRVKLMRLITGAQPIEVFEKVIRTALGEARS